MKGFKQDPSPYPLPQSGEKRRREKEFNGTTHFYSLPQGERRDEK